MSELPKHIQLLDACRTALKPLFRIMLRSGISYKDFNEVSKSLFVEIATNEYGLRGRDTNISRVAIMTGLTRKEVKKIRDAGWENIREEKASTKLSPAAAILHFWHTDKKFLDHNGKPKRLTYEGDGDSFLALAKKYGGDVPPGALFKELIRSEAIDSDNDSRFYPTKRHFIPTDIDESIVFSVEENVRTLIETIDHNAAASAANKIGARRVQRWVSSSIPRKKLQKVEKMISAELIQFCEDIDTQFSEYETGGKYVSDDKSKVVGVGVYYYETD